MTGRNEQCPCGSGKKFKKCCLGLPTPRVKHELPPPEVIIKGVRQIQQKLRAQEEWTRRYGHVRLVINTDNWGRKFVAAGNKLYASSKERPWKYVADFLGDYVPGLFGKEWCEAELVKPERERHPLSQWYAEASRYMLKQPIAADGSRVAAPNGFMAAYMMFAFNLFLIEDNSRFDDDLLARLKNTEQFQGARHEVFAEATCLRAGFSIEHEDERDRSTKHAEFTARHKATGQLISVEAKSRHRKGVLGQPGNPQPDEKLSLRFGTLLNSAVAKNPKHPLVVFIDTNLPYHSAERVLGRDPLDPYKPSRIMRELVDRDLREHGGVDRYAMLVFTNHPHHYARPDELDPQKHSLSVLPDAPVKGITHQQALDDLRHAVDLYGNIPNEFPQQ